MKSVGMRAGREGAKDLGEGEEQKVEDYRVGESRSLCIRSFVHSFT